MLSRRALLCAATLLLGAGQTFAQDAGWANQLFEVPRHDFGVVAKGADVKYRLKLTNPHNFAVHIANVTTSCGCASAKPPANTTINPRETAYIDVSMDTIRFEHQKNSNVIVMFDAPWVQDVRIPVAAYIRADVVLTPGSAEFGSVPMGSQPQRKIMIQYAGRHEWSVRDVINKSQNLDVKLTETGRGGGRVTYELLVTLRSSAPMGEFRNQVTLVTDDASNPYLPVLVDGRVEAEFTTQEVVSFGMLNPGEKKTVNVVIRGKKPFVVEKIESEKTAGTFEVRLPQEAKVVQVLPLTVNAPNEPGRLDELFTVTINGIPEPVQFRAYGQVTMPTPAPNAN